MEIGPFACRAFLSQSLREQRRVVICFLSTLAAGERGREQRANIVVVVFSPVSFPFPHPPSFLAPSPLYLVPFSRNPFAVRGFPSRPPS